MGRREKPLDPADGPVARFAVGLRKVRQEAGAPSYRVMAQQVGYSVTALSQAAAGDRLPSLAVVVAYARACGADSEEWERRWHEVSRELVEESLGEGEDGGGQSPYRGLTRYEPGDEGLFFGRERLTEDLVRRVRESRFTVVLGPSGSGKSSLLRAGLIPRLRRVDDAAERPAALRILTPGQHPLRTHTSVLTPAEGDGDTWLIVDQFEEVFTLCRDPQERAAFVDGLLAARSPGTRLRVVLGVRADFYGRCAEHRPLADVLSEASLLVTAMSAAELREAVVKPAQVSGLIVERELTARLVREAGSEPGALPLLSHALRETWRRRRGRTLTLQGYEDTGGVHGAIARTAEDVHARLSDGRKELARLILLRLIAPGEGAQDTRRPIPRAELDFGDRDEVDAVVDLLARARLITLDDDTVDLAHEALITSWPRLGAWVDAHRDRLRAHRHLTEAARTWEELAHDPGALYRGARLTTAAEHFPADGDGCADLTGPELSFLTASRRARSRARRRRRVLSGALAVLVALSVVAGAVAWRESRTSERRHVEAEARRIAAAAATMRGHDPVTAMRLSVAAWRLAESTETRAALLGAMAQKEESSFSRPGAESEAVATELTADGRTLVGVGAKRVRTWDMRELRPRARSYPGLGKLAAQDPEVTVSPDGRTLAVSTLESTVLWDVRAGRVRSRLPATNGPNVTFSPDGKRVALTVWDVDGSDPPDGPDDMGVPWGVGGPDSPRGAGGADAPAGAGRADQLESGDSPDEAEGPEASSSKVFDVRTGRAVLTLRQRHSEKSQSFALSADNRLLARCDEEGPLEIWDIARRSRLSPAWMAKDKKRFECRGASFVFTPDSRHLARVTGRDIRRWDLRSGREAPRVLSKGLQDVRFSKDNTFVMASTADGVAMWRLAAPGTPVLRRATVGDAFWGFELDLDAGAVRYFNETRTVLHSLSVRSAVEAPWRKEYFSPGRLAADGRTQAVVRHAKGAKELRLVDTRSGRTVFEPKVEPCPRGSEDSPVAADPDDVATQELSAAEMTDPEQAEECSDLMAFSADGRYFAYGRARQLGDPGASTRERVTVWDVRKGREHASVVLEADEMGGSGLDGLVLSADGSRLYLARTSMQETTEVWDLRSGGRPEKVRTLKDISGTLAVRRDAARVASWQAIADPRSGRTVRTSLSGTLTSELAFSPGGQYLAAGDAYGRVTVWNGTGTTRRAVLTAADSDAPPTADGDGVTALAFSHDNATLAVATRSGVLQLWDVPSSQPLGSPLPTPGDTITSLAFSADDRTLYAGGSHVPLQKYSLDPASLVAAVCERAGSGLSRRDWRTYLPDLSYRATC
ncbi:nSTAND1 domain-containing NTPase [Streptomyces flavofungini]|uniref:nSTAND1 domain-containing NTPase n=1 Tax=Streptomyces flavofungini TaxID=68200 RepID=UPI0025B075A0|nr:DNA-binding protein [Streptomyces flavofungini]WJV51001.1 DNA-binding protein [Streptomyces flavofungini]